MPPNRRRLWRDETPSARGCNTRSWPTSCHGGYPSTRLPLLSASSMPGTTRTWWAIGGIVVMNNTRHVGLPSRTVKLTTFSTLTYDWRTLCTETKRYIRNRYYYGWFGVGLGVGLLFSVSHAAVTLSSGVGKVITNPLQFKARHAFVARASSIHPLVRPMSWGCIFLFFSFFLIQNHSNRRHRTITKSTNLGVICYFRIARNWQNCVLLIVQKNIRSSRFFKFFKLNSYHHVPKYNYSLDILLMYKRSLHSGRESSAHAIDCHRFFPSANAIDCSCTAVISMSCLTPTRYKLYFKLPNSTQPLIVYQGVRR